MKNLLSSIILTIGMLSCASCTDLMKDDGSRGFANVATIVGAAEKRFLLLPETLCRSGCFAQQGTCPARTGLLQLLLHRRRLDHLYQWHEIYRQCAGLYNRGIRNSSSPPPGGMRMPDTSPAMKIVLFPNHCL